MLLLLLLEEFFLLASEKNLLKLIFVKAIVKENVVTKAKYVKSEILKTKESDKFVRQEE